MPTYLQFLFTPFFAYSVMLIALAGLIYVVRRCRCLARRRRLAFNATAKIVQDDQEANRHV